MPNEKEAKENKILANYEVVDAKILIPECCRNGYASCPHRAKPIKKKKTNIGL